MTEIGLSSVDFGPISKLADSGQELVEISSQVWLAPGLVWSIPEHSWASLADLRPNFVELGLIWVDSGLLFVGFA